MRKLFVLVVVVAIFTVLWVPSFSTKAADNEASCQVTIVSQNVNVLMVKYNGPSPAQLHWPFDNGGASWSDGETKEIDLAYEGGPHQTITANNGEIQCEVAVTVDAWLPTTVPPPVPGGTHQSGPVGNPAMFGSGIDDCRFFVPAGFGSSYDAKDNRLVVTVQKMGQNAYPFTVYVTTSGDQPWHVQSDPFLGGENGIGSAVYNLPFEVLKNKDIKSISVGVYNAITGDTCTKIDVSIR